MAFAVAALIPLLRVSNSRYDASKSPRCLSIDPLATAMGVLCVSGDIFLIEKYEIADPEFLEDCKVLCVKRPSIIGDKYEVLPEQK